MPRTFLAAVLFASLFVAGCLTAPAHPAPAAESPQVPMATVVHGTDGHSQPLTAFRGQPPSFAERLVGDGSAKEPAIAITKSGTAFVTRWGDFSMLLRSSDQGLSWTDVSPRLGPLPYASRGGDALAYADPITDRLFFIVYGTTCLTLSSSDDEGSTWTTTLVCDPAGVTDHPTFFSGPPPASPLATYPSALYVCYNSASAGRCQRSLDGGTVWTVLTHPFLQVASCQAPPAIFPWAFGFGTTSPADGTVYLPAGICGEPWLAISHDHGDTWASVRIDEQHGMTPNTPDDHEGRVAVDSSGAVAYYWLDEASMPRYSFSADGGATWGPSKALGAPGVTGAKLPAAVAGGSGRFAFEYIGTTVPGGFAAGPDDMATARWDAYLAMTLDAGAAEPVFATGLMNPASDPLRVGPCSDRCIADDGRPTVDGLPFRSDVSDGMFDYVDLRINPHTGLVWGTFVDLCLDGCQLKDPSDDRVWVNAAVGVQLDGARLIEP